MNKVQTIALFCSTVMPGILAYEKQRGRHDLPIRREEWLNFVDALIKEGRLSERAYSWCLPRGLGTWGEEQRAKLAGFEPHDERRYGQSFLLATKCIIIALSPEGVRYL